MTDILLLDNERNRPPAFSCWYRIMLRRNANGHSHAAHINETPPAFTRIELFDKRPHTLVFGYEARFDSYPPTFSDYRTWGDPIRTRVVEREREDYLDILTDDEPLEGWMQLTECGEHRHPDDKWNAIDGHMRFRHVNA